VPQFGITITVEGIESESQLQRAPRLQKRRAICLTGRTRSSD